MRFTPLYIVVAVYSSFYHALPLISKQIAKLRLLRMFRLIASAACLTLEYASASVPLQQHMNFKLSSYTFIAFAKGVSR